MKIIITESQAKRLKLITEDIDHVVNFEHHCEKLLVSVNNVYTKLINTSLSEVFSKEVDMEKINEFLNNVEDTLRIGSKKAYNYIENRSEEDLDLRIDNAYYRVSDKLTGIQLMVMDLEKLQTLIEEHNINVLFNDIKSLDITDKQQFG